MTFAIVGRTCPGMRQVVGFGGSGIGPREGVLLGANFGRAIVTNGDFTAYVCDSAATRPSSQITLGRLVKSICSLCSESNNANHLLHPPAAVLDRIVCFTSRTYRI